MNRILRAHAEPKWYSDSISLHFYEKAQDGRVSYISDLIMTTTEEGQLIEPSDALTIPLKTAQELMDSLWQCGLRPSEGSGSAGSLKATQDHLKDMQELSRRLLSMVERNS
jgi:hypothetical protein